MYQPRDELNAIIAKAKRMNISNKSLIKLKTSQILIHKRNNSMFSKKKLIFLIGIFYCILYESNYFNVSSFSDLYSQKCILFIHDNMQNIFRPPENCDICREITEIKKIAKLNPKTFEIRYAYSGRPVIVIDAMENWTAQRVFSFEFFKEIYSQGNWKSQLNCQFFPYKTQFTQLNEVFDARENESEFLNDGTEPWYVGWSNCNEFVGKILKQHYARPYFLPAYSENKKIDWIFMGIKGYGAHNHVDNVIYPSWQAQLKGSKKWILDPPPECYYECNRLEVIVNPGEIIILDTNRWYHETLIVSNEMSITIGSEYD